MSSVLVPRGRSDRFVLVELLGRGGGGEAWRARHQSSLLVRDVCVKRPLRRMDPIERRSVLEEARVLARVQHSNVVHLLDVAEDSEGRPFLVLELVEGPDLRLLGRALAERRERLSPDVVAAIGVAVCRGLGAAQRAVDGGIVHRDLSPHNVLVSVEGEIKLTDFGVARAFDRERWTHTGILKGKSSYVSPEALRGDPLDVRSDLFSLGIVLFELLAGSRPFEGPDRAATLRAIAVGDRPGVLEAAPETPPELARAVERLLAPDPRDRPPSADPAARMLGRAVDATLAADRLRTLVAGALRPGLARARFDKRLTTPDLSETGTTLGLETASVSMDI